MRERYSLFFWLQQHQRELCGGGTTDSKRPLLRYGVAETADVERRPTHREMRERRRRMSYPVRSCPQRPRSQVLGKLRNVTSPPVSQPKFSFLIIYAPGIHILYASQKHPPAHDTAALRARQQYVCMYLRRELEAPGLLVLFGALRTAETRPAARARVQPVVAAHGTERPRRLLRIRRLDAQGRRSAGVHAELVRLGREGNKDKHNQTEEREIGGS